MNSSYAHKIILNVLNVMSHNLNLGKTKLMKIIYMLQQVKNLNLGYDFDIYTYGPYSSEVLESIEVLVNKGLVLSKMYQYNNYVGYELNLTDEGRRALSDISKEENTAICDILDFAEGKTARDLELFSTIFLSLCIK